MLYLQRKLLVEGHALLLEGGLRLLPGYRARIVDPNEEGYGRLGVRGPGVFAGYLNARAAFTVDGYFLTGDTAALVNGRLYLKERTSDMFVSGGENVSPAEVERALEQHPQIERAGVVGIPDEVWGERGLAFVVARTPMSADEVIAHARTLLAGFKVPVRVEFVAELPTLSIEKLARTQLRERARAIVGMS